MKIQTEFYNLIPYAKLLHIETFSTWNHRVTRQCLEDFTFLISKLYQGKVWGILADIRKSILDTPEAETVFKDAANGMTMIPTHVAHVITESQLKKWQVGNMTKKHKGFDAKFFTNLQDAKDWLSSLKYYMTIQIEIDEPKHLTIYTVTGKVTLVDLLNELESFYQGTPTENVLWDLSDAVLWKITAKNAEAISKFGSRYGVSNNRKKTAIVATDEHPYRLAVWFKEHGETDNLPFKVKVFKKLSEAHQWLDMN